MSADASDCVVDASVAIKLFIAEPLSEKASELFQQLSLTVPPHFHAPDLFYIECANILWKNTRRHGLRSDQARLALTRLDALPLHVASMLSLADDALSLAIALNITAYDAAYVALAKRLGGAMITADEKLVRSVASTAHQVFWLGDI